MTSGITSSNTRTCQMFMHTKHEICTSFFLLLFLIFSLWWTGSFCYIHFTLVTATMVFQHPVVFVFNEIRIWSIFSRTIIEFATCHTIRAAGEFIRFATHLQLKKSNRFLRKPTQQQAALIVSKQRAFNCCATSSKYTDVWVDLFRGENSHGIGPNHCCAA